MPDPIAPAAIVDVVIAAYNAAATIGAAVRSALDQSVATRVIVVDDASTDDTVARAIAAAAGTPDAARLSVLSAPRNAGPAAARNQGFDAGTSPWIAILDADDEMLPDRLERLLAHGGAADLVADDLLVVMEGADPASATRMLGPRYDGVTVALADFVDGNVPDGSDERRELGFIKPVMRRAFLDAHALRYDTAMRLGEDYDFYLRALIAGARLAMLPPQGYLYLQRAGSLSGAHATADLHHLREADSRALAAPGLSPAARRAIERHRQSTDARLQWRRVIDAVKQRRPAMFASAFLRSRAVSAFLVARLWEQALLRSGLRRG